MKIFFVNTLPSEPQNLIPGICCNMDFHQYFISLEDKFIELAKYIQIDRRNYSTFSVELSLLFTACASEFEVVCKEVCKVMDSGKSIFNMKEISECIIENIPEIASEEISLAIYKMELRPLEGWSQNRELAWWRAYNSVKHNRGESFEQANLENVINALAALHIVNFYLIWKRCFKESHPTYATSSMNPHPSLFHLKNYPYYVREW